MYVIEPTDWVKCDEGAMFPFVRYVVAASPARVIEQRLREAGQPFRISNANSYERRFAGAPRPGEKILLYRHAAVGDSLMSTGIAGYVAHRWPECRLDIYCAPRAAELWLHLGHRVFPGLIHFEALKSYQWHILYDAMLENDSEPDQRNAYDNFYQFIGLDPAGVEPEWKRPQVVVSKEDEVIDLTGVGRYLVWHVSAANPNRTYPPALGAQTVRLLTEALPEHRVLLVGKPKPGELAPYLRLEAGRVVNLCGATASFRHLFPVVRDAGLVICPDSAVGHLAGGFPSVPVISLWGLFHPHDRVKYYANHHPLGPDQTCPHAPCRNHEFTLPQHLCKDAANATPGKQDWCNALRAISPERIVETARQLMNP